MKKVMLNKQHKMETLIAILFLLVVTGILWLLRTIPPKDTVQPVSFPPEFSIAADHNYIDEQTGDECSAYAAAFVMRHLGKQVTGQELYHDIHRIFGFVPVHHVVSLFQNYGYHAEAYYGDMDTMRERLSDGVPVIAFVSIPGDTHYTVVVGYDENFVYLADSISDESNADGGWYNRKLSAREFEDIWTTTMYPVKNIYIVVSPQ